MNRRKSVVAVSWALCLLAAVAIWLNIPVDSTGAGGWVAWGLSALPFVLLCGITLAIARAFQQIQRRVDEDAQLLARLATDASGARALLGDAVRLAPVSEEEAETRPRTSFSERLNADPRISMVGHGLDGVLRRRAAGEPFSVSSLREDVDNVARELTGNLHNLHLAAFGVGLAGTVLGLVMQLQTARDIAGGGLISPDFLNGILLKASCTFVGLCVAWFAWALRESLSADIDRLTLRLEDFVCLELGPVLMRTADTASDPLRLVELVVREMRPVLLGLAEEIRAGVAGAIRDGLDRFRDMVQTDLPTVIDRSLVAPFTTEVGNIVTRLRAIETGINDAATGIRAVGDAYNTNVAGVALSLEQLLRNVTTAGGVVQAAAGDLHAVRAGFSGVTDELRTLREEMVATVEVLRQVPSPALQKDVVGDLIRLSEMVYRTVGATNGALAERVAQ
jgi:hypothetical protein